MWVKGRVANVFTLGGREDAVWFGLVWFGTLELLACLQPHELTKIPDSGLPWLWN